MQHKYEHTNMVKTNKTDMWKYNLTLENVSDISVCMIVK